MSTATGSNPTSPPARHERPAAPDWESLLGTDLPSPMAQAIERLAVLGPIPQDQATRSLGPDTLATALAVLASRPAAMRIHRATGLIRVHPNLARILRERARARDPHAYTWLRRQAAAYHVRTGRARRALHLLAADQDWPTLQKIGTQTACLPWHRDQQTAFFTQLPRIPPDQIPSPVHALHAEYLRLARHDHHARAAAQLSRARAETPVEVDQADLSEARIHLQAGRLAAAANRLAPLLARPTADPSRPEAAALALRLAIAQGQSVTAADLQSPIDQLIAQLDFLGALTALWANTAALTTHGPLILAAGQLAQAERLGASFPYPWFTATHAYYQADLAYHQGQLDAAGRAVVAGLAALDATAHHELRRRLGALGALAGAEDGQEPGTVAPPIPDPTPRAAHLHYRAALRQSLARRDRQAAALILEAARRLPATPIEHLCLDLDAAALLSRSLSHRRAAAALGAVRTQATILHLPGVTARAAVLEAEALLALGKKGRAEQALAAGLLGLEPERLPFLRPLRPWIPRLLDHYQAFRRLPLPLLGILADLAEPTFVPAGRPTGQPSQLLLDPGPPPRALLDGRPLPPGALPPHAIHVLLAAAQGGGVLSRAAIRDLLPPEPPQAAHHFWNTNRDLRRALGPTAWHRHGLHYRLGLPFQLIGEATTPPIEPSESPSDPSPTGTPEKPANPRSRRAVKGKDRGTKAGPAKVGLAHPPPPRP